MLQINFHSSRPKTQKFRPLIFPKNVHKFKTLRYIVNWANIDPKNMKNSTLVLLGGTAKVKVRLRYFDSPCFSDAHVLWPSYYCKLTQYKRVRFRFLKDYYLIWTCCIKLFQLYPHQEASVEFCKCWVLSLC